MIIEPIELKNYHDYKELHTGSNQGTNVLHGDSAQGKTNILEAVYTCCISKPHKSVKDRNIIRFNRDESHIELQIRKNSIPCRIDMHLEENRPKGIAINGVPIRRVSGLFDIANVAFFSPEDLNVIENRPSEERRFVNMELCRLNKLYVHSLVQYNKVLLQRNELLKELFFRPEYEETLDAWNTQLVNYGREVIKFRREFIKQLNGIIHVIHLSLMGGRKDIFISCKPSTREDRMEDILKENRAQDVKQKITLSGLRRDNIGFIVNDIDIRRLGSQGQQHTIALSLKLSELQLAEQLSHDDLVLLLDDVSPEPDNSRQDHLLSAIKHIQITITRAGLNDFISSRSQIDKVFKVIDGTVINEN